MRPRVRADTVARMTHWTEVEVRYSDLDQQGHVNNAVYFTYFEQARVRFFGVLLERARAEQAYQADSLAPPKELELPFVVAEAHCTYRLPISGYRPVRVGIRCSHIGGATIELEYVLCDQSDGRVYASGSTALVAISPATGRATGLPAWVRSALAGSVNGEPIGA